MAVVTPYNDSTSGKGEQVEAMFDKISHRYDFLNRLLSMGIDVGWRKKALRMLENKQPDAMLDIATGTGDFALMAHKIIAPKSITGADISEGMLSYGRKKVKAAGLKDVIRLEKGNSEDLRYEDNSFNVVSVAFGVRNFEHLRQGLKEMLRVAKPGGEVLILEFSKIKNPLVRLLYNIYFKFFVPVIGKIVSGDMSAYRYLPESVDAFPSGTNFVKVLRDCGYQDVVWKPLTFGACSIYIGKKG